MNSFLTLVGWILAAVLATALLVVCYWSLRPNAARVDPSLAIDHRVAVRDGMHNSNTDLAYWRGHYYLIHASSPWHLASSSCKLVLWRSRDARVWERVRDFRVPETDIRDPKLASIGGRLFLYALPNEALEPRPYETQLAHSQDGESWSELRTVEPEGWLFWKPRSRNNRTWYVPAYVRGMGKAILLSSEDGESWSEVSVIHEGDGASETDMEFLPDGRMIATVRLEFEARWRGQKESATLIAVAGPPYKQWQKTVSHVTRLDGPSLFASGGKVYALGRHHPGSGGLLNRPGGVLGRKRTALYQVEPDGLTYLSDLPSAGDTAYAGTVVRGGELIASYYTNDITRDFPWILGMFRESEIRIARIGTARIEALAEERS
jgi:hypothetical protein